MPFLKKFFDKPFFKKTAFGRTLTGRNKTGQTIGAVANPILIATGLKPAKETLGRITGLDEIEEIAVSKGKSSTELSLNLTAKQEQYIRLGLFLVLVIASLLGVSLGDVLAAIKEAATIIEHLPV